MPQIIANYQAGVIIQHSTSKTEDYKTYNNIANQTHLFKMREKGYFKDVDTNVPIREILDNCEVIKR